MGATVGDIPWLLIAAVTLVGAAFATAFLIFALGPLLRRYALAKPGARSSHQVPTPQGGGIAVITAATAAIYISSLLLLPEVTTWSQLTTLLAAVILLASVGVLADTRPIAVAPRLLLQIFAVAAVVYQLPSDLHVLPILPSWIERALLVVGGVWFVNLVNFMDGLDWITVAQVVPITAAIAAIGLFGLLPPEAVVVSLATCGAMIGFSFFNRPVAKLFLGDVGSLPLGLVLGWLLVLLAGNGGRAAAFLLPLYPVADGTLTLLYRLLRGERVWEAHRSHFYQRATDGGFSVIDVVTRVFLTNVVLCGLAVLSVIYPGTLVQIGTLLGGTILVAWLLVIFARGKR
jgi:UDP-N-acetylmuramyl pentapeptide phosphotransferase/UDP-N-acetylglucosamine-1-phosphate transferase